MEERGVDVGWGAGAVARKGPEAVARSVHLPTTDAATGQGHRVDTRVMIAAGRAVDTRRAAKIGEDGDERGVERATVGEILQERRHTPVEDGEEPRLEPVEVVAVGVPHVARGAVEVPRRAAHLHHRHSRLGEPARQEQAAATDVVAIRLEHARTLAVDVMGLAHRGAKEDIAGQVPEVIVRREVGRPARRMVESRAEFLAA